MVATRAAGSRHEMSYTRESTFGATPSAIVTNVNTIDADDTDDSYNDSGSGFGAFKAGDLILVSGFTTAANNGQKTIVSATAAKIVVAESLTTEAAGDDITIVIDYKLIRNTGTTLNLTKDNFVSEEIRSDRAITELRHGNKQTAGDINIELGARSYDELLEALLQGTWAANVLKAGKLQRYFTMARYFEDVDQIQQFKGCEVNSLAVTVEVNGMVTGTFGIMGKDSVRPTHIMTVTPKDVEIGDIFSLLDNCGQTIVSYTAAAATVADVVAGLTSAWNSSTNAIAVKYTAADVGSTHMTLTGDAAGTWHAVTATAANGGAVDAQTLTLTHAPVAPASDAPTTQPFDSFTGEIKVGGGAIVVATSVEFSLENGLDPAFVLMDPTVQSHINGRSNATGTLTAHFFDGALYQKFVDEDETSLEVELEGPAGNKLEFLFPRVKFTAGDIPVTSEDEVTVSLPFQALFDETEATNLKITRTLV